MEGNETRRLLKETLELARENNRMLRKMRRNAFIGGILRIVWWAAIIGVPVYLYFAFLQPYLQELSQAYTGVQSQLEGLQEIPEGFQGFLDRLQLPEN